MSPDAIARIRNQRGFNIPWAVIAKTEGATVEECRQAIGMPLTTPTPSEPAPWVKRQRDLFDQPNRGEVSER